MGPVGATSPRCNDGRLLQHWFDAGTVPARFADNPRVARTVRAQNFVRNPEGGLQKSLYLPHQTKRPAYAVRLASQSDSGLLLPDPSPDKFPVTPLRLWLPVHPRQPFRDKDAA